MKRFFFVFLTLAALAVTTTDARAELPVLDKAPAWKLKDIEGKEISSTDFKGKVVVLDFWATWCPPCVGEIPGYVALQKKYGDQGLVIIGISVDDGGAKTVAPFAQEKGINYTMLLYNDDVLAAFGGVEMFPTTFLIDRAGNVRNVKLGALPEAAHDAYEKQIVELLK